MRYKSYGAEIYGKRQINGVESYMDTWYAFFCWNIKTEVAKDETLIVWQKVKQNSFACLAGLFLYAYSQIIIHVDGLSLFHIGSYWMDTAALRTGMYARQFFRYKYLLFVGGSVRWLINLI